MQRLPIIRQIVRPSNPELMLPDDFVAHLYPFSSLPLLRSHLHPKFAIVYAGRILATTASTHMPQLTIDYPSLSHIVTLYSAWTRDPPPEADPLFKLAYNNDNYDNYDDNPSCGDSDNRTTGPCRSKRRARQATPTRDNHPIPASGSNRNRKIAKTRLADRIRKWSKSSQSVVQPQISCP
jgi:hypothetical protein